MSPAIAATNLLDSTEFIVGTVSLVAVLLGAAIVLWALDRWRKREVRRNLESTESLSNFRALFERGEISEAEYKRIRDRVSNRMRREVGLPGGRSIPADTPDLVAANERLQRAASIPATPPEETTQLPPPASSPHPPEPAP